MLWKSEGARVPPCAMLEVLMTAAIRSGAAAVALVALLACDHDATVLSRAGAGGSDSTTGSGSGTVTAAGGGLGACPSTLPAEGEPCESEGLSCIYPWPEPPCETIALCLGGLWTLQYHPDQTCIPVPPPCPATLPVDGERCAPWDYGPFYECGPYPGEPPCPEIELWAYCDLVWIVDEPVCTLPGFCEMLPTSFDCQQDPACVWLEPGCGPNPLPQPGCFPVEDCNSDPLLCSGGTSCQSVSIDPCWNAPCQLCDAPAGVCL